MSIPVTNKTVEEKVVTLYDISWQQFKGIETQLVDHHNIRLSYLSGLLEIMSPIGDKHEYVKKTLSYLLEAYMKEKGIRFYGRGGFTLEQPGYASGTPDESYCIGTNKQTPDIVIEIIVISGSIDRKELYKPSKVPEVWFWKSDTIRIFSLNAADIYEEVTYSRFFPNLDLTLLLRYIAYPDQYDAVAEFIQSIKRVN